MAKKTNNKTETIQVGLFGGVVDSSEVVERHQINLASENPKDNTMTMQVESAIVKHDKNLVIVFGVVNKTDSMLCLFTKHSDKYPSESMPNGQRLGNAVSRAAEWTTPTKTYDDVVAWLSANDCTLVIAHSDKGRLFTVEC